MLMKNLALNNYTSLGKRDQVSPSGQQSQVIDNGFCTYFNTLLMGLLLCCSESCTSGGGWPFFSAGAGPGQNGTPGDGIIPLLCFGEFWWICFWSSGRVRRSYFADLGSIFLSLCWIFGDFGTVCVGAGALLRMSFEAGT